MATECGGEGESPRICYVHCEEGEFGTVHPFTKRRWGTFLSCALLWLELDGPERLCAETYHDTLVGHARGEGETVTSVIRPIPSGAGYHEACYRRFIDKRRIEQATRRREKGHLIILSRDDKELEGPSPKRRRSSRASQAAGSGIRERASVLPNMCIICKKYTKILTRQHKRVQDRLCHAETETAGKLKLAADFKCDENILLHIRDKDCVAIEVKYHSSCFKDYTRCLTKDISKAPEERHYRQLYMRSYNIFCETIIRQRIIKEKEIFRMATLVQSFIKLVKQHEGIDIADYRTDLLKYHLKRDFPQLQFHRPYRRNTSELVFIDSTPVGPVFHKTYSTCTTETDTGGEDTSTSSDIEGFQRTAVWQTRSDIERTRSLFNSGILIKNAVKDAPNMDTTWPPTSSDITRDAVKKIVPVELYNLLAWCTGVSDLPTLSEYVDVSEDEHVKILSISQDIIYLCSKGRRQTPKSLCLGLTVRHLTGSSQLLNILSKFGHTASYDTIVSFETGLAELQLSAEAEIPPGFCKETPTVLIWDNIDFGEETLSGKGTTHHTNGILVQRQISTEISKPKTSITKGKKSLSATVQTLEPFHLLKRQGPQNISHKVTVDKAFYEPKLTKPVKLDFLFILAKIGDTSNTLPGWTGFNAQLQINEVVEKSSIKYLPVIEASPTELSTVNMIFKRSLDIAKSFGLKYVILVFDQAIYAKAQQIRWKDEILSRKTIIRLGEFHTCMSFCGVIGKRFRDAGLSDIFIESEVVAQGSIEKVLNGHHYNRSIRAHKLKYEAMQTLRFQAFLNSLSEPERDFYCSTIDSLGVDYPTDKFKSVFLSNTFNDLVVKYKTFVTVKSQNNATFGFWSSYIDMIQNLLHFVRGTRESDWELHLSSVRMIMPWFFAYDHTNYARYLPAYWVEMINLPISHPESNNDISVKGQWTVQRSSHPFSSIACDQAIEQTLNRDSKTGGGIRGITLNRGAVKRWTLAQSERAALARKCEEMAGILADDRQRKDLGKSRIQRDNSDVRALISTIESMINPFSVTHDALVCISSGAIADETIQNNLLNAQEKGEEALMSFIQTRLISKEQDIFQPIKTQKLKTFSDLKKSKVNRTKSGKEVILRNDRKLFARLLVLSQNRDLNLRDILSYSLGNVSYPLANNDGSLAKTNKAALLTLLESKAEDCHLDSTNLHDNGALIIDAMALLQAISIIPKIFGELADTVLQHIVSLATKLKCNRVDFVTDRYPEMSIKNPERSRRAAAGTQKIHIYSNSQKTPNQWKKFLSNGENKEELFEYLYSAWISADLQALTSDIDIYIAHKAECHCIQVQNGIATKQSVDCLHCDHEEAGTRLILHAKHASLDHNTVVIRSPDTDFAVIALCLLCKFEPTVNIYFMTGTKSRARLLDLRCISTALGTKVCSALIGLHVFTGCDSTSAFFGKGKTKAFTIAVASDKFLQAFDKMGTDFELSMGIASVLESFVCRLYGQSLHDINETRYKMFCLQSTSDKCLPPTKDALLQHLKRCNFQCAIHKRAIMQVIGAPSPSLHGWNLSDGDLKIVWMTNGPAPDSLLDPVHCGCKKGDCSSARCSCSSSNLSCTELCQCFNCQNTKPTADETVLEPSNNQGDIESDSESEME